jgi:hypothetical protein
LRVHITRKPFWTHWMKLLGDVGYVESRFGTFGDSVSVSARQVNNLCQTYHKLRNCFGRTQWNLVTWVKWNLIVVRVETMLVSVQDRCMVCTKRIIGSENILDAPDGTSRLQRLKCKLVSVHFKIVLILTEERCTVCAERTKGLKSF